MSHIDLFVWPEHNSLFTVLFYLILIFHWYSSGWPCTYLLRLSHLSKNHLHSTNPHVLYWRAECKLYTLHCSVLYLTIFTPYNEIWYTLIYLMLVLGGIHGTEMGLTPICRKSPPAWGREKGPYNQPMPPNLISKFSTSQRIPTLLSKVQFICSDASHGALRPSSHKEYQVNPLDGSVYPPLGTDLSISSGFLLASAYPAKEPTHFTCFHDDVGSPCHNCSS